MQRLRARLECWTAPTLALFVSTALTPHTGLYFHHHVGGDHPHVHADGDATDHHARAPHHQHTHHHADLTDTDRRVPSIEAPDDDDTGHWHCQDFFQPTLAPAIGAAPHLEWAGAANAQAKLALIDPPTVSVRVRGPPHPA